MYDLMKLTRTWAILILVISSGLAGAADYYTTRAAANYRPVVVPGTQRRVAQTEAEEVARKEILRHVGELPTRSGYSVNSIITRDARLRAKIYELVRRSELVDWVVEPQLSRVTVCMRIDRDEVRALIAQCGY